MDKYWTADRPKPADWGNSEIYTFEKKKAYFAEQKRVDVLRKADTTRNAPPLPPPPPPTHSVSNPIVQNISRSLPVRGNSLIASSSPHAPVQEPDDELPDLPARDNALERNEEEQRPEKLTAANAVKQRNLAIESVSQMTAFKRSSPTATGNKVLGKAAEVIKASVPSGVPSVYSDRRGVIQNAGTRVPKSLLGKRKSLDDAPESSRTALARTATTMATTTPIATTPTATPSTPALEIKIDQLPGWYHELKVTPRTPFRRELNTLLSAVRNYINELRSPTSVGAKRAETYSKIRHQIHRITHQSVTDVDVKKSKLLEQGLGLPQIFAPVNNGKFPDCPFDISADAREIFLRWCRADFDADILRGVNYPPPSWSLKKDRPGPKLSAKYFGEGDLVPGQWWPNWICMYRDGAHGVVQGGIYGEKDKGAMSIVMSSGGPENYEDVDEGDVVQYSGTQGAGGEIKDATQLLRCSLKLQQPVRLMRSSKLGEKNPYQPVLGVRYDGLYKVTGEKLVDQAKAHYVFRLERVPGQSPIRYRGDEARPYPQEIDAFRNHPALVKGEAM